MTERIGVFNDAELQRIVALPRREQAWSEAKTQRAIDLLTEFFKTPQGKWRLKPIQARALVEAADTGTLVGEICAGGGKSLIVALLFTLWNAKRGLLLVPAHLREKTEDEWAILQEHWRLLPLLSIDPAAITKDHVRLLSYSSLSTVRFAAFLDEFQPDVIAADESHNLARLSSARGKRFFRYIRKLRPRFSPQSGTPRRKSLRECAHIYDAALGDQSPFPRTYPALEQLCAALDEGVPDHARIAPGALATLSGKDDPTLDEVRRSIRDRILATPGVVATTDSGVGTSLVFQARDVSVPKEVEEAMRRLRTLYELPTGESFDAGVTAWNHAREVVTGFAYRWDPPAPDAWANARREWNLFVDGAMSRPPKGLHLDSPLQVWNAVKAGHFGEPENVQPWTEWRDIRDSFEPNPVPHWISDYLVKDAEQWALDTGGIVWVAHTSAFTKADDGADDEETLSRKFSRIPYFGAGKAGDQIRSYKGPCVASYRAHGTGKNLTQWHRALWMCFPSSGSSCEQLVARHHRDGQMADEVRVEFYCHSREMYAALRTAQRDARFMEDLNGSPQRILTATILGADGHLFPYDAMDKRLEKATTADDPLWAKNGRMQ